MIVRPKYVFEKKEDAILWVNMVELKTITDFKEAIEYSLVWTGYEDCHIDEDVFKIIHNKYLKTLI